MEKIQNQIGMRKNPGLMFAALVSVKERILKKEEIFLKTLFMKLHLLIKNFA
jgi:hypothetical protein